MADLASELGMSKKTLYSHFSSKHALLEAALLDKFTELGADLDALASRESADFIDALKLLLDCFRRHGAEISAAFARDVRRDKPDIFKFVQTRRRECMHRHFGKLLGEGREAGLVRDDVPVHLIVEILLGAVDAIVNPQKVVELGLYPKDAFEIVTKLILEGALSDSGRKKL